VSAAAGQASEAPAAAQRDERQTRSRRRIALAGGIAVPIAAALAITVVAPLAGSSGSESGSGDRGDTALATVERGRLSSQVSETGTLGYAALPDGSPYSVVNQASGPFTALPSAGDVIRCGRPIYRVADEPVVLLCGRTPAYRALAEGMSGPDVRQLNRNLVALGYADRSELDPSSDYFGSATAAALEGLQAELGLDETGALEFDQAVFLPGPLRVTGSSATLGTMARPGVPIAHATSTRRQVRVDLNASLAADVEVGDRARITLPDNRTARGAVSRIGSVAGASGADEAGSDAGSGSDSETATTPVYIELERANDAGAIDEAPVEVAIITGRVKDALSVPVTALLARAGGGYAVETVGAGGDRDLVPVQLGTFDHENGLVHVTGSGLEVGQRVVVPAT
jgi:peptidoglycan hydrolase-like protein with peptidoglycan-binding domain